LDFVNRYNLLLLFTARADLFILFPFISVDTIIVVANKDFEYS